MNPAQRWPGWPADAVITTVYLSLLLISLRWFDGLIGSPFPGTPGLALIGCYALAVLLVRAFPALGLTLLWFATLLQMSEGTDAFLGQIAVLYVLGAAAARGSRIVLLLSGLSVLLGAALAAAYLTVSHSWIVRGFLRVFGTLEPFSGTQLAMLAGFIAALFALPWLLGVVIRLFSEKRVAENQREEALGEADTARELARLRAENAALARDVHDVVGHSLAVIIAQADSIGFIPDTELSRIREVGDTIADAARRSLGEVRAVLSQTAADAPGSVGDGVAGLLEGVRGTGRLVQEENFGTAIALPAQVNPVVHRVAQEMLANALHHGDAASALIVRHYWGSASYTLSMANCFEPSAPQRGGGRGIDGMRERLASVGGTLSIDTDAGDGQAPARFVVSATFPVRAPGMHR